MLAISQKLLSAASVDETTATTPDNFEKVPCVKSVHTIEWGTGVTSGVVEIEAADDNAASAWSTLGTITFAGSAPKTETFDVDGPYGAFRHRISTVIGGGTVTTKIRGWM